MDQSPPTAAELVAAARSRISNLTPEEVASELASGDAVLVDIRDIEERAAQGAIPGAVHASRGMLEFHADPSSAYHKQELDPQRRTILHCGSGGRSALAVETLQQMGYTNIAHLGGGINAWKEAGLETTASHPEGS
jgi:rhodanese-related sulfurtransferase